MAPSFSPSWIPASLRQSSRSKYSRFHQTSIGPPCILLRTSRSVASSTQTTSSPPIIVSPSEFPDPSGLMSEKTSLATWQVVCNITRPKRRKSRCCVSFSAYYNDSVVPYNTCACGCAEATGCDPDAPPLLRPSEALLIPFQNRTAKAKAWAEIKHRHVPSRLPCGDYYGVGINWHIVSIDTKKRSILFYH